MKTAQILLVSFVVLSLFVGDGFAAEESLTVTPEGNVGIGTSTPTVTLEVNGEIKAKKITLEEPLSSMVRVYGNYDFSSANPTSISKAYTLQPNFVVDVPVQAQDLVQVQLNLRGQLLSTFALYAKIALVSGPAHQIGNSSNIYVKSTNSYNAPDTGHWVATQAGTLRFGVEMRGHKNGKHRYYHSSLIATTLGKTDQ